MTLLYDCSYDALWNYRYAQKRNEYIYKLCNVVIVAQLAEKKGGTWNGLLFVNKQNPGYPIIINGRRVRVSAVVNNNEGQLGLGF